MTKVKPVPKPFKGGSKISKSGAIIKKKSPKFKNTPTGKVPLINTSLNKSNGTQVSKNNGRNMHDSPKGKQILQSGTKNNTGSPNNSKKSPQAKVIKKEDDDDSDDDINEGISIKEEVSAPEDEVDDDDSSDDGAMPDIFGTSLAEETDDDDDEFDADSDEDTVENKGVKMFKGLKKTNNSPTKPVNEDEDEDDNDDDDDDDDDEDDEASPGLKALLGQSLKDESDDEDFDGEEDSEEDDDESDEEVDQSLDSSAVTSANDDEEDDDDDDEEDEDDSSPDLTALLGNSLADESDDEDFEDNEDEDEDDDISDDDDISEDNEHDELPSSSKKSKVTKSETVNNKEDDNKADESKSTKSPGTKESHKLSKEEETERDKRTIYIGNIPKEIGTPRLKSEFSKFGPIDTIRIRGIIPKHPKMSLKVAGITKQFHPKSTTVSAFVTYKNEESVAKALSMNGKKLDGNYLRVDRAHNDTPLDKKKSVFLGNLPFIIDDNDIWEAFKECGKIDSVRIVRDRNTGLGRGFGYVNFESVDGATLALNLHGTTIKNRELRVTVNTLDGIRQGKSEKKLKKRRHLSENAESESPKKLKVEKAVETATRNSRNAERRTANKRSQGEKQRGKSDSTSPRDKGQRQFQGQTADSKKKPKQDKSMKRKKHMAAKLLAKPKKPSAQ